MGQRIAKHTYEPDGTWIKSKYYVRDAQGNVLSVYDNHKVLEIPSELIRPAPYTDNPRFLGGETYKEQKEK